MTLPPAASKAAVDRIQTEIEAARAQALPSANWQLRSRNTLGLWPSSATSSRLPELVTEQNITLAEKLDASRWHWEEELRFHLRQSAGRGAEG